MFVKVFRDDLERDGVASAMYLPMKDEEGVIGILLFEARQVDFASEQQRNLAAILANQTTVAIRNAQLYRQVPMADALGALAARKQALLAIPGRRRALYVAATLAVVAGLTLIRWPLRVAGIDPELRPHVSADSIAVDLGVAQENVMRVHVGDDLRLRVAALPNQTFSGRVTAIADSAVGDARSVRFPVRAIVANDGAVLKPGMTAYVRVLTEPTSTVGRLVRGPMRTARLWWWRLWS
jgi:multidrug efflux pump subunit AcrA (membrane-fusion protein)